MAITALTWALALVGAATGAVPPPIIDMHLHANPAPPGPATVCAPYDIMPERDPRDADDAYNAKTFGRPGCRHPFAIAGITDAPFLTAVQKRDILHDNAARFLRLVPK